MIALDLINSTIDPEADELYVPLTPADAIAVEPAAQINGCYETYTGTHYPTLDSVPWQAAGSAVLVECDGYGPAHS